MKFNEKTPKQGKEGVHIPIGQVDALRPNRRDRLPERGPLEYQSDGFMAAQDFGKAPEYPYTSRASGMRAIKGLVEKDPPASTDRTATLQNGIYRQNS